jgi:AcrR family transcriptional regulator
VRSSPEPASRADRSAARRDAILRAALDEFCERGFAATSVEDVARRADVAKGTIYLNFKDKEALLEALIRATLGEHIARLEMALKAEPGGGASMRDTIEAILSPLIEQIRTTRIGDLLRLVVAESGRFPQLAEFYHREMVQRAMGAIGALSQQAVRTGELTGDELVRFPQIIAAPVVVTLLWTILFERFAPLDASGLLRAHLELIFGKPPVHRRDR